MWDLTVFLKVLCIAVLYIIFRFISMIQCTQKVFRPLIYFFTSAKEVVFSPMCLCLFVGWFVCLLAGWQKKNCWLDCHRNLSLKLSTHYILQRIWLTGRLHQASFACKIQHLRLEVCIVPTAILFHTFTKHFKNPGFALSWLTLLTIVCRLIWKKKMSLKYNKMW